MGFASRDRTRDTARQRHRAAVPPGGLKPAARCQAGAVQSGVGREGGEEALRFFTEAKNVCVKLAEAPAR